MPQVAPFPYFGGKRRVAAEVWSRFGDVKNYVEPFFGSGAVLLHRDTPVKTETVNDLDGLLCNFWRAVKADPEGVAAVADWPVSEADLHPRHLWLVQKREDITQRLMADADWYDVKAAGWWVWGACAWIGGGWCSGRGPWSLDESGAFARSGRDRQHLGVDRRLPHVSGPRGINRKANDRSEFIRGLMTSLGSRLRETQITSGSWERVVSPSVTLRNGLTAVFVDPPYVDGKGDYPTADNCTTDVRAWAIENGDNPRLRVALCGYDEHNDLANHGWTAHRWKAGGGYGNRSNGEGRANSARETVWFSPHCLKPSVTAGISQMELVKEAS